MPELMAPGVNVALGHDCVMDPWYGLGSGDMLEVAHMGLHVAQMTSQKGMRQCFDAVTSNAAKVMHLQGYGLEPGCDASFVLLQARDPVEAIQVVAETIEGWTRAHYTAVAHSDGTPIGRGRFNVTCFAFLQPKLFPGIVKNHDQLCRRKNCRSV